MKIIDYDTELWFGPYKGHTSKDIPSSYLLWVYENLKDCTLSEDLYNDCLYECLETEYLDNDIDDEP